MVSQHYHQIPSPAVVNTAIVNKNIQSVQVIVNIVATATIITKNNTAITGSVTNETVTVNLGPGESITVSQTTAVTWTWWLI